ncbi:MAG: DUF2567 domain-containing protein [Gordonia sp. (in: high G+C Gram-positive bacteria)]|uniref:DUF2567 domain-containing protein n=1 Tax=Gordonia sp. (in: high G+C Gram-positive bacteria) TaxID=84139 RepID=UPI0039E222A9
MSEPVILAPGQSSFEQPVPSATGLRANRLVSRELIRVVLGIAALAALAAVVWSLLTPMPTAEIVRPGVAAVPSESLGEYFDGIGWFCVAMMGVGVVAGSVFWWYARSWRGPLGAVLLAVTTVVSSGLAIEVGLAALAARLPDAAKLEVGATFLRAPKLWMGSPAEGAVGAPGILLIVMPTMALLTYLFHVLLADRADLAADSPEPVDPVDAPWPPAQPGDSL